MTVDHSLHTELYPEPESSFAPAHAAEHQSCVLCGGETFDQQFVAEDYEYKLPGHFFVARCRSCGLVSQNPRPTFNDILRYYPSSYDALLTEDLRLATRLKLAFLLPPRIGLYRRLIGEAGSIIDIGCGNGSLLRALREVGGWDLYGVDPSHRDTSSIESGITMRSGTLEQVSFARESFDLAIMNHSLEHVPDPRATAAEVYRILKPGGHFCGEVPNLHCIEQRVYGRYWAGYHLPRHVTFFEPATLTALLASAGFVETRISMAMQPSSWLVSASNLLYHRRAGSAARLFSDRNIFWLALTTPVTWMLAKCGSAASMRFVCRKTS